MRVVGISCALSRRPVSRKEGSHVSQRLGVCIVGSSGAVATTVMAGVQLMKKGIVPRNGMLSEGPLGKTLGVAPIDGIVFGGWDLRHDNAYEAALHQQVVPKHLLDEVKDEL